MAINTPVDELIVEFGGTKVRLWLTESGLVARPFRKSALFRIPPNELVRLAVYGGTKWRHQISAPFQQTPTQSHTAPFKTHMSKTFTESGGSWTSVTFDYGDTAKFTFGDNTRTFSATRDPSGYITMRGVLPPDIAAHFSKWLIGNYESL